MLKIKDDVDLKELEKFGFQYISGYYYDMLTEEKIEQVPYYRYEDYGKGYHALIREDRRICCINKCEFLYDLIKADLVEKVSD